jgi:hypothetical protein
LFSNHITAHNSLPILSPPSDDENEENGNSSIETLSNRQQYGMLYPRINSIPAAQMLQTSEQHSSRSISKNTTTIQTSNGIDSHQTYTVFQTSAASAREACDETAGDTMQIHESMQHRFVPASQVTSLSEYLLQGPTPSQTRITVTRAFVSKKLFAKVKFITDAKDLEYRGNNLFSFKWLFSSLTKTFCFFR